MATRMTPLTKGLIGAALFGVFAAGYFHLKSSGKLPAPEPTAEEGSYAPASSGASAADQGHVGTAQNPLKVSIVSFHGYAPALYANGNALKTKAGSLFAQKGVQVEFLIQDNVPSLPEIFGSKTAHCAWRTSDFFAQEQPNLRNAHLDAKAVVVVDNTQGADGIVSKDPSIKSIEDLAGHSVALIKFTPSHGMLIDALENSSLSARQKASVKLKFITSEGGPADVRAALESGSVDAAATWDPDLSLALKTGAHVVYSTKIASNLIYDIMVCDTRVLGNAANTAAMQAFVDGWLAGIKDVNANKALAARALVDAEVVYKELAEKHGAPFVSGLFSNLELTDLAANVRILGLNGGTNHYERVYHQFDEIYRGLGTLTNPNSPIIDPSDSFDYRFIRTLMQGDSAAVAESKKEQFTFSPVEAELARKAKPVVTKPVVINFETNSSALTNRAESVLDNEVKPLIDTFGSAYFEISGNTDATGTAAINKRISEARARAVAAYLTNEWQVPAARFRIVGNGSERPLCNEANPEADGMSLEQCRAQNRTTRIAVLSRAL
jgi:NitT/TauT family transport system substrate-binding protein